MRAPAEIPKTGLEHGERFPHSLIPSEARWVGVGVTCEHSLRSDEEDGVIVDPDIIASLDTHCVAVITANGKNGDRLGGGGDSVLREDFADPMLGEFRTRCGAKNPKNYTERGYFAINIHSGGENTTSSWGCQTLPPEQFAPFIARAWSETLSANQHRIPYLLVDGPIV